MTFTPEPASELPDGQRITTKTGAASSFGGAIGWTVLGTIVPGLGLWRSGRRVTGAAIMAAVALAIASLITLALVNPQALKAAVLDPNTLYGIAAAMLAIGLGWVTVITTTHLSLRPRRATPLERIFGGALVGVLSFAVAAPLAFGSNLAYTSATGLSTIFGSDTETPIDIADPWEGADRFNVLLLGGDSGTKRAASLGARTDTVMVASVDVHTGATTLFTFPRNATKMPFPPDSPLHKYYPNGFTDPSNVANAEYFLNAMYRNVPAQVPNNILGKTKDFGAKVMMVSTGYALGLKVNHYAFINMDGFKDFMNAIGGITVNVNYRIPVGGATDRNEKPEEWIEPGPNKHLTGGYALWYARGRYSLDDYSRMERQRCVVNAVIKQADPATILSNYQAIVASGEKTVTTNIPRTLLPALLDLAMKAKNAKQRSLVLDPDSGFVFGHPDWAKVRSQVKKAIKETAQSNTSSASSPTSTDASTPAASTSASASASPSASKKAKSEDLDDACAYHPHAYTKK